MGDRNKGLSFRVFNFLVLHFPVFQFDAGLAGAVYLPV